MSQSTFDRCGDATLEKVRATYAGRGQEYGDTWAIENQVFTFMRIVLGMKDIDTSDLDWLRLLKLAALIDVKDDRHLAGPHADSFIDSLAYRAVFAELMREYLAPRG